MQLIGQPHQLACPQCAAPMSHLSLAGRDGRTVPVDHCTPCRLVWFDRFESVQLAGLGWIALLRELQQGLGDPLPPPRTARLACPLCRVALKPVHNRTRFGRFPALECPRCQGHLHSHAGVLAERGLVRPLLPVERRTLQEDEQRRLCCLNCGAPADGQGEACAYCRSPFVMLDLPRLAQALRLRPGRDETKSPTPAPRGRPLAWPCRGCGAALDPSRHAGCPQCGHAVLAPSLLDVTPLLDQVETELRAEIASRTPPAQRPPRRRVRDWRDTGLARLLHRLPPEREDVAALGWQFGLGLLLWLAWRWLF